MAPSNVYRRDGARMVELGGLGKTELDFKSEDWGQLLSAEGLNPSPITDISKSGNQPLPPHSINPPRSRLALVLLQPS